VKRRMVGAGGVVLVVALSAIGGWYVVQTRATKAQDSQADAQFQTRSQPVSVTFNVQVPDTTPKDQVLYLSGSVPALGNWDAAGVPLVRGDDGAYHAKVDGLLNSMDYFYKVTRGTWGTVETDASGKEIANHSFEASREGKVDLFIAGWIDNGKAVPGRVTTSGDIRLHKKFHSNLLGNERTLIVYLPPAYDQAKDQKYPVLYLQDGQNLFDESTSYQGIEWGLDETAQQLIAQGKMKPAIIVGVYNTETRTPEFTPALASTSASDAKGDAYAKMLVEEVKPFIDQHYRTLADRSNTTVGGGSQGALIALYAAKTHNDVFGAVVALSPWLRLGTQPIGKDLIGDGAWLKNTFTYIDMGSDGGQNYPGGGQNAIPDAQRFVAALEKDGLTQGKQFIYREIEGGKHNESSWNATGEQVLLGLYGINPPTSVPAHSE
jgi:predicted alpha/beta superfamily hydrolase